MTAEVLLRSLVNPVRRRWRPINTLRMSALTAAATETEARTKPASDISDPLSARDEGSKAGEYSHHHQRNRDRNAVARESALEANQFAVLVVVTNARLSPRGRRRC